MEDVKLFGLKLPRTINITTWNLNSGISVGSFQFSEVNYTCCNFNLF